MAHLVEHMAYVGDTPWHGPTCGLLRTEPAAPGGVYGYEPDNCTFHPVSDP